MLTDCNLLRTSNDRFRFRQTLGASFGVNWLSASHPSITQALDRFKLVLGREVRISQCHLDV